jgi:hypothetical protein
MNRRLFNAASAISLLLCVASAGAWVRSYFQADRITWLSHDPERWICRRWMFRSVLGGADLTYAKLQATDPESKANYQKRRREEPGPIYWGTYDASLDQWGDGSYLHDPYAQHPLGIQIGLSPELTEEFFAYRGWGLWLSIPYWAVTMLDTILPARWALRWYRDRRRFVPGQCNLCGYDLRATPDRCPECGTIPAERAAKPSP